MQLDSALAIFSRLGATPWAEQARGELRATGATTVAQAAGAGLVVRLTAQELQVVRRAAAGLANREIAAELFLSPRTVACQPQLARRLIRRGSRWSSVVFMSGTVTGNLIRLVLSGTERQGADPRVLVREAGLPGWALEDKDVRFPTAGLARLWQVSAARLEDPRFGLRVAAGWRLGACELSDYIFDTAATLGDAFAAAFAYTPLLNSAGVNDIALAGSGSRGLVRYQIRTADPAINAIATEFALGTLLQRARHATGRPVAPLQVALSGRAPRSHGDLARAFGTRRVPKTCLWDVRSLREQ